MGRPSAAVLTAPFVCYPLASEMLEVSVPFIVVRGEGGAESDRAACAASLAQSLVKFRAGYDRGE